MSFRNSVAIVASPRPRVGKTLLARLLTDFHLQEGRSVAAFDLNAAGEGTLAQFLPEHVTRSSIDDLKGRECRRARCGRLYRVAALVAAALS
jgi:hypothetical protein